MVRIVALDIDKDRGMFCGGLCKKWLPYNTYSSGNSSWILNGLMSSCFDKCWYDISDDESGMAKDIRFKPRVEATEQMTQNWTLRSPRTNESAKIASKWHVCSSYFLFAFYFTPENLSWGTSTLNPLLPRFITVRSSSENIWQKCLKCFFSVNLYWILIGKHLGRYFLLISS